MKTAAALAALGFMVAACGGDDTGHDETGAGGGDQEQEEMPWGYSENDSSYDDGSAWPKWKPPCPGPACDPPRDEREWVSNPPPDEDELPAQQTSSPSPRNTGQTR